MSPEAIPPIPLLASFAVDAEGRVRLSDPELAAPWTNAVSSAKPAPKPNTNCHPCNVSKGCTPTANNTCHPVNSTPNCGCQSLG